MIVSFLSPVPIVAFQTVFQVPGFPLSETNLNPKTNKLRIPGLIHTRFRVVNV